MQMRKLVCVRAVELNSCIETIKACDAQLGALREQLRLEKASKMSLEERNTAATDTISACMLTLYIFLRIWMLLYNTCTHVKRQALPQLVRSNARSTELMAAHVFAYMRFRRAQQACAATHVKPTNVMYG